MSTLLNLETTAYNRLRIALIEQHGLAEDDEALIDTLEGATNLKEAIFCAAREAQRRAAQSEAMASIIKDNQARKDRHQRAAETIRDAIALAMSETGLKKIETPDMTLSFRMSAPAPKVVDEALLPSWATKNKVEVVPDRLAIKAAYANNPSDFNCPGVVVSNAKPSLIVRTK